MNATAISTRRLGKQYPLAQRRASDTLRDAIAAATKSGLAAIRRTGASAEPTQVGGATIWALRDISFSVAKGEVVGIIGRNGAGKSTLLKILSRITPPTEGAARVHGRLGSLLEVGAGFHPELTGRENIYLNGAILGMSRAEIRRKFDAIVGFAEVDRFVDTPVKRYSSGMYVRLAFAVAAHLDPQVLIVDEVLAVGDNAFQRKCLGRMDEVRRSGRTVLFVSHNMAAIQQLCTRVLLLKDGALIADGPPETVVETYLADVARIADGPVDVSLVARGSEFGPIIQQVSLYDAAGVPAGVFGPEDTVVVELVVAPPFALREPRIAAAIEDSTGRRITTVASYFRSAGLGRIDGPRRIRCTIPRLGLGSGRYLLSLSVHDSYLGTLDSLENVAAFEVEWRNNFGTGEAYHAFYGPVLTPSHWEQAELDPTLWLESRAGGIGDG